MLTNHMIGKATKKFLAFLKLTPRHFISLGLISAVLLFADEQSLKFIGVFDFVQHYRLWLGTIFVVSIVVVAVFISADGLSVIVNWWMNRKLYERVTRRLNCLSEDEKQILRFYIANQTRTNFLRHDDEIVQDLISTGIIYYSSSPGSLFEGFAHNISDIAWEYLYKNAHLLNGTTTTIRTDDVPSAWSH